MPSKLYSFLQRYCMIKPVQIDYYSRMKKDLNKISPKPSRIRVITHEGVEKTKICAQKLVNGCNLLYRIPATLTKWPRLTCYRSNQPSVTVICSFTKNQNEAWEDWPSVFSYRFSSFVDWFEVCYSSLTFFHFFNQYPYFAIFDKWGLF